MKVLFLSALIVLVVLSVVAWRIQPARVSDGKISLVWTSDDNPARREQIELFNSLNPRCRLSLDPNNVEVEKVIVQSIAGVGPDLFDCYTPNSLAAFVKAGIAWDVTDEIRKAGIDVNKDVWNVGLSSCLYKGRLYGFPTNCGTNALWYHKDLFDRAGIPYPKGAMRWKDIIPLAQRLTIKDDKGRVKQFGLLCDWGQWSLFILQWGGRVYSEDGSRCVLDSPEAIAGLQFMHDLVYKYHVCPNPVEEQAAIQGGWATGVTTWFGAKKGAMALGGRWWLCTLRTYKGLRLGAVEAPHGSRRVFVGGGRATMINRYGPRRREALAFLLYLAGKDYNELLNHQGDALGPMIRYCYTDRYLHDPVYPQEDYNEAWRDPMKYAVRPPDISPFVNGDVASRIIWTQMDLIRNDQKSVAEGMTDAARLVNMEIQRSIERDPDLRKEYQATLRKRLVRPVRPVQSARGDRP